MLEKKNRRKVDFIKYRHGEYDFVIARHKRFIWMKADEEAFVYFIYITRRQKRFVDKNTAHVAEYNILCFSQMYPSFLHLMNVLDTVLSEYLLDNKSIFEIAMLCNQLYENEGETTKPIGN